jgi:exonuclease SbcD
MTHLFFMQKGGERMLETDDEKPILTVGGAQEIYTENLPRQLQYVALGHLHRPFSVSKIPYPVVYSGSPLAYSMSEAGQEKSVVLLEVEPGQEATYQRIKLEQGKPLARQTFDSVGEAETWLQENPHALVELTLVSEQYLSAEDRKRLLAVHDGIIAIIPRIQNPDLLEERGAKIDLSRSMEELFTDYFQQRFEGQEPGERMLDLFREVLAEDE